MSWVEYRLVRNEVEENLEMLTMGEVSDQQRVMQFGESLGLNEHPRGEFAMVY